MYKYVKIIDGVVVSSQESSREINHADLKEVDGDLPAVGSFFKNGVFTAPVVEIEPLRIRTISIGAFRRRLTLNEKLAINASSDLIVTVLNEDLNASAFVDLDFEQLINGLNYFANIGILTPGRVTELLQDGTDSEQL